MVPRNGKYEVRITEELREVSYLDRIQLIAVDHPAATSIYTNDKFKSPPFPDFQFPQTLTEGLAAPGWRPHFGDHLYVAFTNVVAFSPTDTLPLTLHVKALMALQSLISLSVLVVVLSRVINILPS